MDALLGTMPDAAVGARLGISEDSTRRRRGRLGLPTFRAVSLSPIEMPCANCGETMTRPRKAGRRSKKLFCSRTCADAGQKRRDSETLRYGPGWKNTRARIRARDTVCRACGRPPTEEALHVHHLRPFRVGGTNLPTNLVGLCDSCHHTIEAVTTATLDSIPIAVTLDGSTLTITVDGAIRWRGSVVGAGGPMPVGSTA
jgi:hypothetical protein